MVLAVAGWYSIKFVVGMFHCGQCLVTCCYQSAASIQSKQKKKYSSKGKQEATE